MITSGLEEESTQIQRLQRIAFQDSLHQKTAWSVLCSTFTFVSTSMPKSPPVKSDKKCYLYIILIFSTFISSLEC
jgi:hypothetical protein